MCSILKVCVYTKHVIFWQTYCVSQNIYTVDSQFFEPPSETKIDLKKQIVWEISPDKIRMFD